MVSFFYRKILAPSDFLFAGTLNPEWWWWAETVIVVAAGPPPPPCGFKKKPARASPPSAPALGSTPPAPPAPAAGLVDEGGDSLFAVRLGQNSAKARCSSIMNKSDPCKSQSKSFLHFFPSCFVWE